MQSYGAKSGSQYQPALSHHLRFASSSKRKGFFSNVKQLYSKSRVLRVSCEGRVVDVIEKNQLENPSFGQNEKQFTCVMKFGGSSVASAERMREVAHLILSFPEETPVIVLSAMGKTTNKLLLVYIYFPPPSFSLVSCYIVTLNLICLFHLSGWRKSCHLRHY